MSLNDENGCSEKKCGNCCWFNGEEGDDTQFCDKREFDIHESGYCYLWRIKETE